MNALNRAVAAMSCIATLALAGVSFAQGVTVRGTVMLEGTPTKSMIENGYANKDSKGLQWAVICLEGSDEVSNKPQVADFVFKDRGIHPHIAICGVGGQISVKNERKETCFLQLSGFNIRDTALLKTSEMTVVKVGEKETNAIQVSGFNGADIAFAVPVRSRFASLSDKNGNYSIVGVPAGNYTMRLQHVSLKRSSFGDSNGQSIQIGDEPVIKIPPITAKLAP